MIDGGKLRAIRRLSEIPNKTVLERLGQSNFNYLFRLERGEVNASYEMLLRVAAAFEVPPAVLVKDEVKKTICGA